MTLVKYLSLKKNNMANIIHLNTLLSIMIMMLLGYINEFEKSKITKSLMVKDKQLLEKYNQI